MKEAHHPIAFLVALREELETIRPLLREARPGVPGGLRGVTGRMGDVEVVAVRTGIGRENAGAGAAKLLEAVKAGLVIVTGFAGGLRPGLHTGDILIASEVCELAAGDADAGGNAPESIPRWPARPDILDAAYRARPPGEAGPPVVLGRLVTVDRVLKTTAEKRALGERLRVDAVDMESGAVIRPADRRGVPVLCVRAILDDVDCKLTFDFGRILALSGKPRPMAILGEVARHPSAIPRLLGLGARARKARESLRAFLPGMVRSVSAIIR